MDGVPSSLRKARSIVKSHLQFLQCPKGLRLAGWLYEIFSFSIEDVAEGHPEIKIFRLLGVGDLALPLKEVVNALCAMKV